jgi:hypothetical protein
MHCSTFSSKVFYDSKVFEKQKEARQRKGNVQLSDCYKAWGS